MHIAQCSPVQNRQCGFISEYRTKAMATMTLE